MKEHSQNLRLVIDNLFYCPSIKGVRLVAGAGNAPASILAYETRVGLSQPAIENGSLAWARSTDNLINSQVLYQLSY